MGTPHVSERAHRHVHSSPHKECKLAIVIDSAARTAIEKSATDYGVTIDETLPSGVLLITVPVDSFEEFLTIPGIQSVATLDEMEVMN